MYQGRCLCGQVEITVTGPISAIIHCHCSKCRKNSGTAYATNGFVARSNFNLVRGEDKLTRFATAQGKHRFFCRTCGSPVYSENLQDPDRLRLRLGILDSQINERPESHNFMQSKANWDDPDAQLPRYDGMEPGRVVVPCVKD